MTERGRIFLFNSTHHFAHFEPESLVDFKRSSLSFIIIPRCFSFRTRGPPALFPLMSLVSATYLQIFVKCLQKQAPAGACARTHTQTVVVIFYKICMALQPSSSAHGEEEWQACGVQAAGSHNGTQPRTGRCFNCVIFKWCDLGLLPLLPAPWVPHQ